MSGSTNKKVIIQRFDREALSGFLNPGTSILPDAIEFLDQQGRIARLPYEGVKLVSFVKEWEGPALSQERKLFNSRPKSAGLWVRAQFRDNDFVDGLLANDLLHLEAAGFMLVPPDPSSNTQRIFIPRKALLDLKVLGVVGGPARKSRRTAPPDQQIRLFD